MEEIRQPTGRRVPSAPRWLVPQPADWVPLCVYTGVWVNVLISRPTSMPIGQIVALTLVLLALVIGDRWRSWRYAESPPPFARLILFLFQALLIEAAVQIEGFEQTIFLYLLLPFTALLSFGGLAGMGVALLIWLVFALKVVAEDTLAIATDGLVLFALAEGFVVVLSLLVVREQRARIRAEQLLHELHRAHAGLHRSHKQLTAYAETAVELATVHERNRLAREIHDSLGHALTALAIQLEQAQAFRLPDAAMADRAVASAKQLADDALEAVRRSVGVLRLDPQAIGIRQGFEALIMPLRAGLPELDIVVECDSDAIPLSMQPALMRIVQEGLTNVRRHAQASHVSVRLNRTGEAVVLTIADDGRGFDRANKHQHTGYGLQGIAERAALLGGQLDLHSAPGAGTTVCVVVPIGDRSKFN